MEYRYFEDKQLNEYWERFLQMDRDGRSRFIYRLGLDYTEQDGRATVQNGLLTIDLSARRAYGSPIQYRRIGEKLKEGGGGR